LQPTWNRATKWAGSWSCATRTRAEVPAKHKEDNTVQVDATKLFGPSMKSPRGGGSQGQQVHLSGCMAPSPLLLRHVRDWCVMMLMLTEW
jgi:hypothetical protein